MDALVNQHGRAALMVLTGNAPDIATYERLGMAKCLFGAAHIAARLGQGSTVASRHGPAHAE
ncbi:hypothetical protein [Streptomyces ureilyticus]|uniref:hypothetical protein n=1 Tax=Streptomyces ureilyticus TaxID=1775131 RepID=UPI001F248281|nr:hypothetical protein [Streptomyces ureilyticus]